MPRPCRRVRLESGLKLDINRLARRGFIQPGALSGPVGITWVADNREIASGIITADLRGPYEGSFRIQIGSLDQTIHMVERPRNFGGHQWFFVCPFLWQRAMVLWRPPGAHHFACRRKWGKHVAYASQFGTPTDRAHWGQAKIRSRLRELGSDSDNWEFPPKPKGMRWSTYNRLVEKFDQYEETLDERTFRFAMKFYRSK